MGDDEVTHVFSKELKHEVDRYSHVLDKMFIIYSECLRFYCDSMQRSMESMQSFAIKADFMRLHEKAKNESMTQVQLFNLLLRIYVKSNQ